VSGRLAPLPFALSRELSEGERSAIEAEAMRANDSYVIQFLEKHGFCPYARAGRERGATARFVHFADSSSPDPLRQVFDRTYSGDLEVVQIIFPLVEIEAAAFARFVNEVTDALNRQLEKAVFASAALHPQLSFRSDSATGLISLFRRAPDPTLQWVRLSTLDAIYRGRKPGTSFVDLSNLAGLLDSTPKRDLYDEIAQSNRATAEQLGVQAVEWELAELYRQTQANYAAILEGA
jgi:hypothetical protein